MLETGACAVATTERDPRETRDRVTGSTESFDAHRVDAFLRFPFFLFPFFTSVFLHTLRVKHGLWRVETPIISKTAAISLRLSIPPRSLREVDTLDFDASTDRHGCPSERTGTSISEENADSASASLT